MKKGLLFLLLLLSTLFLLVGCSKQEASHKAAMKTVTFNGTTYEVPKEPKRIVVLSNSVLYMLNELGATAVGRTESLEKLPDNLQSIPTVGHTAHVNLEALLALKPDLVIGLQSQQEKLIPVLKENNIPHMMLQYEGIDDNTPLLLALGQVLNKEDTAKKAVAHYESQIQKVQEAIKNQKPVTVAVLFATGKSITAETDRATAASMVHQLHMTDVVAPHITKDMSESKSIPYSLETLTMDNPEVIFIVSMGKRSDINEQMKKSMTDNPAWNQLQAVKNQKVFYLPSELFLLNPGLKTPEAMAELVKDAYGITVPLS